MYLVMDRLPQTLGYGFWKFSGEMGLKLVEQGYSSFFAKFLAYLMLSQSGAYRNFEKNHPICQTFVKKMKKNLVQLALKIFFG